MTAPDVVELGRRAVACGAWRPVQGMADASGEVVVRVHDDGTVTTSQMVDASRGYDSWQELWTGRLDASWLPDLSDAATLGALLGLVREAWRGTVWVGLRAVGEPVVLRWRVFGLHVVDSDRLNGADGFATEAEALVVALERAPVRS